MVGQAAEVAMAQRQMAARAVEVFMRLAAQLARWLLQKVAGVVAAGVGEPGEQEQTGMPQPPTQPQTRGQAAARAEAGVRLVETAALGTS